MYWPSLSLILSGLFVAYTLNGIYSVAQLFYPPKCGPREACLESFLNTNPRLQLVLFTSVQEYPRRISDLSLVAHWTTFDYDEPFQKTVDIALPASTRKNGTLHLHVYLAPRPHGSGSIEWHPVLSDPNMVYATHPLTQFHTPDAPTLQLLSSEEGDAVKRRKPAGDTVRPSSHFRSKLALRMVTEELKLPGSLPLDLAQFVRLTTDKKILPLLFFDTLANRIGDLHPFNGTDNVAKMVLVYSPVSLGKHRLWKQFEASMSTLTKFGFSAKDVDEVKGIFTDTNAILLCITFFVATIHLLLDFLAFKNDISFWRNRTDTVGVSRRTLIWRAFSQFVICFYLLDERSSLLVLGPSFVGALIELWKIARAFRVSVRWEGITPKVTFGDASADELSTSAYDAESMKYLSYLLYPLCFCGAIYSLLYVPHRSWYSWAVQSMANGVYAFGFLFMLPQLFVNYKLKSVAHLPWRAFMYKAFNTFIDDLFAFIIVMPTAHRVACFRDDVVFVIYLYQRWLYPVDHKRVDSDTQHLAVQEETKKKK